MKSVFAVLALLLSMCAWSAEPTPGAQREIAHLIAYAEKSGCEFYRNGTWHPASEVGPHLRKKTDYLRYRELLSSAEDFIVGAASESSITRQAYRVRCPGAAVTDSAGWFRAELERYRKTAR